MAKDNKGNSSGCKGKYNPKYCTELIEYASKGGSFKGFAGKLKLSRRTLYDWLENKPEFRDAKDIADSVAYDYLEQIGLKAMRGEIEDFNATAWVFNMKNRCDWRDKTDTKIDAKVVDETQGTIARQKLLDFITTRGRE